MRDGAERTDSLTVLGKLKTAVDELMALSTVSSSLELTFTDGSARTLPAISPPVFVNTRVLRRELMLVLAVRLRSNLSVELSETSHGGLSKAGAPVGGLRAL